MHLYIELLEAKDRMASSEHIVSRSGATPGTRTEIGLDVRARTTRTTNHAPPPQRVEGEAGHR
jgi:hypothetical protein